MKREREEISPLGLDQLPPEILIEIFQYTEDPLLYLVTFSQFNRNLHNILSLHTKRQQLLSFGMRQIVLSHKNNFTYFLDTLGRVFIYGKYNFSFGDYNRSKLKLKNQYPYHLIEFPSLNNIHKIIRVDDSFEGTFFLSLEGDVFVVGENYSGELGIGDITNQYFPVKIKNLKDIKEVVSVDASSYFLTRKGQVFSCGNNQFGQLGVGSEDDQEYPILIEGLENIERIITHMGSTFFIDTEGNVFVCGNNEDGQLGTGDTENQYKPKKLTTLKNIKHVFSMDGSTFFINDEGRVFACGNNEFGQLGIGNRKNQNRPIEIKTLKNIVQIIQLEECTFLLDGEGQVFACGNNVNGRLGIGNTKNQNQPQKLETLKNIKHMVCDSDSLFFIDEEGRAFALGENQFGQLGVGDTKQQKLPQQLETPNNIARIVLDHRFPDCKSTFCINNKNQVYVSGSNAFKNLGIITENKKPQSSPIHLNNMPEIAHIYAQYGCTFLIDFHHQVYAAGDNKYGQLGFEIDEVLDKPTLIPFFVEQRRKYMLHLAEKWDIPTLEKLVKDNAPYSELCNQVLLQKQSQNENATMPILISNSIFKEYDARSTDTSSFDMVEESSNYESDY